MTWLITLNDLADHLSMTCSIGEWHPLFASATTMHLVPVLIDGKIQCGEMNAMFGYKGVMGNALKSRPWLTSLAIPDVQSTHYIAYTLPPPTGPSDSFPVRPANDGIPGPVTPSRPPRPLCALPSNLVCSLLSRSLHGDGELRGRIRHGCITRPIPIRNVQSIRSISVLPSDILGVLIRHLDGISSIIFTSLINHHDFARCWRQIGKTRFGLTSDLEIQQLLLLVLRLESWSGENKTI
ncbi:hypothetical protein E6O75_ATG08130 [Venturia nashicola]|uniref:Uncharacterized protein n=1 Tax=Venturia nashicola TaxID=86259 RepID=A0A4Z1NRF5_9PEZI|nr:hypothetical protein E6O75_ATG08130 [Venturia nashicola]